jgi:hypothetical protein
MTSPSWSCYRCLKTTGRHGASKLCKKCWSALRAANLKWCHACKTAGPAKTWHEGSRMCYDCRNRARRLAYGIPDPPKGFVTVKTLAARLHLEPSSIRLRLLRGWAVSWMKVGHCLYIEDRQSYPPMRRRGAPLLQSLYIELVRPKRTRELAQGRSYASVCFALQRLKQRGLVKQVKFGVWGRV